MDPDKTPTPPADHLPDLDREAVRSANDFKIIRVPVPEWSGAVYVKTLKSHERDTFEAARAEARKEDEDLARQWFRAMFVQATCCDALGNLLFTDADLPWLANKACAPMDRIFDATGALNRFFNEDIEALVKNWNSARSVNSGTR